MEPTQDKDNGVIDVIGDTIYIMTGFDAPHNRLVTATVDKPQRQYWKDLVPEQEGVLTGAQMAGDKMILTYDKDASCHAYVYDRKGNMEREIEFPTFGQAGFSSDKDSDEVFYTFTSFLFPSAVYSYNMADGTSTLYNSPEVKGFNPTTTRPSRYSTRRPDGTMIPMYLTYRKDLKRDGKNPVYLYGYGGFNISLNPGFSAQRILWLENGGIYAQTNLRGGGEYGEEWHKAGTKTDKLNVFTISSRQPNI